jgi:hypothetical protein
MRRAAKPNTTKSVVARQGFPHTSAYSGGFPAGEWPSDPTVDPPPSVRKSRATRARVVSRPGDADDEDAHQRALVKWADLSARVHPELRWLYAVPNGGRRDARTGGALKRQGVRPGVPDLVLPVARGGWFGLYVELKRPGKHSRPKEQLAWIAGLVANGYRAAFCVGWEEARQLLTDYLACPPTVPTVPPAP